MKYWIVLLFIMSLPLMILPLEGQAATRSQKIYSIFNEVNANTMHLLDTFYHPDIVFEDPLGSIQGLPGLKAYYQNMYTNVTSIKFDFSNEVIQDHTHVVMWTMILQADGLNGGDEVKLDGNSVITFHPKEDRVIYHRDYFDMGQFIYEHIPVLGYAVRKVKERLQHTE